MPRAGPAVDAPRWPGLDQPFHEAVTELSETSEGRALRKRIDGRFMYAEGKPHLHGPPQLVRSGLAETLRRVTSAYHRVIDRIVRASLDDEAVRVALSTPPGLARDLESDRDPANRKIHILRIDILLDPDGGFRILETNANCPGGFVFTGIFNRAWREFLEERGYRMPPALEHETKGFMANWFLSAIEEDTGSRPDFVGLLREEGGNRYELDEFAKHVRWHGVECEEIDPREIEYDCNGSPPRARGRRLTHAYQKLGMQRFLRMRPELDGFVGSVRDRSLFVQNGQRGRWVGDDKLCLAIISNPRFAYLFDDGDLELLQPYLLWSRNARLLDAESLKAVRGEREHYVLKRGLDTRGQGIVVGKSVDQQRWLEAVDRAVEEAWLVQEFHATTYVRGDFDSLKAHRHDLALGAINGELTTLYMRSSSELRVNMARTGKLHPVFLGAFEDSA